MTSAIERLITDRRVIVCCGPGGVGKTTSAAAIGVAAAMTGRRACVITIDPARRLADALAIGALTNAPRAISGAWDGTLDALALDAKATFDDLVRAHASDGDQAERILANALYQSLVSSLSGTQEYMATEKLHQLLDDGRYDVVVVDTPPSRNALDFLDAPARLSGFLDNKIMRMLLAPTRPGLHAVGLASEFVLRNLGRVAGKAIVEDTVAFFRAFSGMEEGFRARAAEVGRILTSPDTAFVLVAAPRRETIAEITFFAGEIAQRRLEISALVVNRVLPDFGRTAEPQEVPSPGTPWANLIRNLDELSSIVATEVGAVEALLAIAGSAPSISIPLAPDDIHDLAAIETLARRMLSGTVR